MMPDLMENDIRHAVTYAAYSRISKRKCIGLCPVLPVIVSKPQVKRESKSRSIGVINEDRNLIITVTFDELKEMVSIVKVKVCPRA